MKPFVKQAYIHISHYLIEDEVPLKIAGYL